MCEHRRREHTAQRICQRAICKAWLLLLVTLATACQSAAVPPPPHVVSTPTRAPVSVTATVQVQWALLPQRPLHLPTLTPGAPCPRAQGHDVNPAFTPVVGAGPVYAAGFLGLNDGILPYASAQIYHSATWGGNKVLWVIAPDYEGPVLIRGHQLDGPHELRFDGGVDDVTLQPELRLIAVPENGAQWSTWPTNTRIEAPGCYAYQVDGLTFSYSIVFLAQELTE